MAQGVNVAGQQAGVRTGQGAAEAEYQKSKDQSGMNIFNAVTGLIKLGQGA
jgi:hypothetical protein